VIATLSTLPASRILVLSVAVVLFVWDHFFTTCPSKLPDVAEPTRKSSASAGHAAEEVEQQITVPRSATDGVAHMTHLRSVSLRIVGHHHHL